MIEGIGWTMILWWALAVPGAYVAYLLILAIRMEFAAPLIAMGKKDEPHLR